MPLRLTCPQGHRWELAETSAASPALCPICGAMSDTLTDKRASESSAIELPPVVAEDDLQTRKLSPNYVPPSIKVPFADVQLPGYEVLDELGRGGAGVVYKARHLALDRLVALKVLATGPYAGIEELARFRGEAEAVARLRHPHIVCIHDVGQANGRPYFALEYLPGGSLAAKLLGQPQPPRQAAEMVRTLARAVHFAHQNGILHRDLKPGNVLLDADGAPKVADFGLAKRFDVDAAAMGGHATTTGTIMGTPSYMSPEQARGGTSEIGPAVDVYGLGAILYEMLGGRPPFLGETLSDTLLMVLDAEPIAPRRLHPRVPRDLETICLRCLQKKPSARFASAEELADDLDRFLDGRPILSRPVGRLERALKWARRRPAQAALLAVSTLALLLGGAGLAWHQIELERKNDALAQALTAEETQRQRNVQLLRVALQTESGYGTYLDDQLKPLPHLTRLRGQLLEKRLAFYKPILDQEPNDPEMRQTQGLAYLEMGIIQKRLGKAREAEKAFEAAIERLEIPADQATSASRRVLANACIEYGMALSARHEDDKAADLLERGQRMLDRLATDDPTLENRHALALACHNRALFLGRTRQFEPARQTYERAIELRQQMIREDPHEDQYQRELAGSYVNLGALYLSKQQLKRAREEFERAADTMRRQPLDVENRYLLAGIYHNLGMVERDKTPKRAIEDFQRALKLCTELLSQFPAVPDYRRQSASVHFLLALQYEAAGDLPKARQALHQHLAMSRELLDDAPTEATAQREVVAGLYHMGRLLRANKQNQEAETLWREELRLLNKMAAERPTQAATHQSLSFVLGQLGDLDRERGLQGRFAPAWPLLPAQPHVGVALHNLVLLTMGKAYLRRAAGEYRQAIREQRQVMKFGPLHPMHYSTLDEYARLLAVVAGLLGSFEDMNVAAEGAAEAAQGLANQADGGNRYFQAAARTASCIRLVAIAGNLSAHEKTDRARRYADRAVELLAKAIAAGFRNVALLEQARELVPLRNRPDFRKLVRELKEKKR